MTIQDELSKLFAASTTENTIFTELHYRFVHRAAVPVFVLLLAAVDPALAQTTDQSIVCQADGLSTMISGFFQLTTGLGVIGLVIVWQGNSLMEMFSFGLDAREKIKRHKRTAFKSTGMLLVLGPLYTVAGSTMGLPLASCVDLAPW
ncbi:hypothetical protein C474_16939 [Halogeometricum pallidum JCM 14848]|uniref:Uncharacterized protein n=1 Tax=Halogeometricum pallidum JCM 14848 TaxID=1227487 RepID=M0CUZ0_HALPD|nr:hypothetical protein [Halogeometricum pallidum]ELZ27056.1 hypothetical protein C474_16939 [Halogeometricum pallidum JCM 14848]